MLLDIEKVVKCKEKVVKLKGMSKTRKLCYRKDDRAMRAI